MICTRDDSEQTQQVARKDLNQGMSDRESNSLTTQQGCLLIGVKGWRPCKNRGKLNHTVACHFCISCIQRFQPSRFDLLSPALTFFIRFYLFIITPVTSENKGKNCLSSVLFLRSKCKTLHITLSIPVMSCPVSPLNIEESTEYNGAHTSVAIC